MRYFFVLLFLSANSFCYELKDLSKEEIYSDRVVANTPNYSISQTPLKPKNPKNTLPKTLDGDPLIVVHASSFFDENFQAKEGIDKIVSEYDKKGEKIIYLIHDQSPLGYELFYPKYRTPDYEIFSAGGEHNLPIAGKKATVVGGFFGSYDGARGCHALALRDAIRMHFELSQEPLELNVPLEAVYFYEEDLPLIEKIKKTDPQKNTKEEIKKTFENFAELFFLVDNFETSSPDALGFAHPFLDLSLNPSYKPGRPVDTEGYSFEIYFENILVSSFGKGPKKTSIKIRRKI